MKKYSSNAEVLKCLDWADSLNMVGDYAIDDENNPFNSPCQENTYKVVLVATPNGQYTHWYRQDSNGLWSHKMGSDYPTYYDTNGELIYDPRDCAMTFIINGKIQIYTYVGCFEARAWQ